MKSSKTALLPATLKPSLARFSKFASQLRRDSDRVEMHFHFGFTSTDRKPSTFLFFKTVHADSKIMSTSAKEASKTRRK